MNDPANTVNNFRMYVNFLPCQPDPTFSGLTSISYGIDSGEKTYDAKFNDGNSCGYDKETTLLCSPSSSSETFSLNDSKNKIKVSTSLASDIGSYDCTLSTIYQTSEYGITPDTSAS